MENFWNFLFSVGFGDYGDGYSIHKKLIVDTVGHDCNEGVCIVELVPNYYLIVIACK